MDSLVNGAPGNLISIYDRGLAYGDGVFETMAVHAGEPLLFADHMERLQRGCMSLDIAAPDIGVCRDEIERLCGGRTGIVKLIITRGSGGRGYAVQGDMQPNRVLLFLKWDAYPAKFYTEGIRVGICRTRVPPQERLAGIKHLNRLDNVLAAREFDNGLVQEGLMLDWEDRIIECTRSNIFFVKDGQLHTPDLKRCGVSGVMRNHILRCAREKGVQVHIRDIHLAEVGQMDEAFVSNSLIGAWFISRLGDKISYVLNSLPMIRNWTERHTLGYRSA